MRAAVYFTPPEGSELARLAATWLGRDAFTGRPARPGDPAIDAAVADPARYGFHATLKAPFRLRDGVELAAVEARLASFCAARPAASIHGLSLARLGSFFALVPDRSEPSLTALEAATLEAFEPFRAPLTDPETARRRPERLSERQRAHLAAWGYPFVLDEFHFHMSLTGAVEGDAASLQETLEQRFAPVLGRPLAVGGLALFVEPRPGDPFVVHAYHPLAAASAPAEPMTP